MYSSILRPRLFRAGGLIITALLLSIIVLQPVAAQAGVVWDASYFNNPYLSGDAAVERQDTAIAFNWGTGAPWPGVNVDNFSVRWGADPYFAAGTYRFYVLADDSVGVTIDFALNPQIDTFNKAAIGQILTADVTLSAGIHHIQVDYRELTGNAYVYVTWENLATNPTGPNFPVAPPMSPVGGTWTAQYYANAGLVGSPSLILSESTPSHNWGAGAPAANLPADNFSARWTSVQTVTGGNYQISTQADDGVRVYVDGILYINEWHNATGQTYTVTIPLTTGQHNFQVEFYEGTGDAFLNFNLTQINVVQPPVVNPPASTTGTVVRALRLNVRGGPSTSDTIVTKVNRNESYPVIGKNSDGSWYQINVNGTVGWVYWRFFDVNNPQIVPVVSGSTGPSLNQPPATGVVANTLATVNVRSGPSTSEAILAQVARGNPVSVVGRNAVNSWWQVNFGGITGWVNARFAPLQPGTDVSEIPITG